MDTVLNGGEGLARNSHGPRNRMLTSPFILTQEIEGEEGGKEKRRETETEKAQECRKYSWVRKPQHPSPVRDFPEQCHTTKG